MSNCVQSSVSRVAKNRSQPDACWLAFGEYLLTQEEIIEFGKKWDPQFFHIDPEAADKSVFSGLIAAETHLLAITVLQLITHQPRVSVLAGLGWDEVRFLGPARPGDALTLFRECLEIRPSASKLDRGVVKNRLTLLIKMVIFC